MNQISLDFVPGLTEKYATLKDCVNASLYSAPVKMSVVAAACDLSPSELSKLMNGTEGRKFDMNYLIPICKATGDLRPLYYLIEELCEDREAKRERALNTLAQLADALPELLKHAGLKRNGKL